jgi:hypothetical protein
MIVSRDRSREPDTGPHLTGNRSVNQVPELRAKTIATTDPKTRPFRLTVNQALAY